jgi:cell wall-associated NlpC family hydrolase
VPFALASFQHLFPRIAAAALRRATCRVAAIVVIAMLDAHPASAAEAAHTDRSLANSARGSLAAAATRMVQGTREVTMFALSLVGIEYRWGGDTPDRGLDCSGLIRYVFQEVTGVTLPRTARELSRLGRRVRERDLEPGDLVFFNTRHFPNSHVGIYLGGDRFIHSPSSGGEVGVATLSARYWQARYNGARRLAGLLPGLVPSLIPRAEASVPPVGALPAVPAETPSAVPIGTEP